MRVQPDTLLSLVEGLPMRRSALILSALTVAVALLGPAPAALAHEGEFHFAGPRDQTHSTDGRGGLRLLGQSPSPRTVNTDLAFTGTTVVQGNYNGFRLVDTRNARRPTVLADVVCNGGQGDVSVYEDLVVVSVDAPQTAPTCDSADTEFSEELGDQAPGFEGLRIFDISDPRRPELVTTVPTDCGSHTHTLVPHDGQLHVYVSSYPLGGLGETPYGTSCEQPHSKISVVEVPLDDPAAAAVVNEPELPLSDFLLPDIGLTEPGVRGCHDIGVFIETERAAAACLGEGQIWDISDPVNPVVLERITNPGLQTWHSGSFTWDGKIAIFGDEHNGAATPGACADPSDDLGRVWFYDAEDAGAGPLGSYKIPRPQTAEEVCTAHNYNVVPVADRYVLVSSWYQGGTSLVDFTDPSAPEEIAHYDGDGAYWSSYWYNGRVYGSDIEGGLDVFRIGDRSLRRTARFDTLNPQTQESLLH